MANTLKTRQWDPAEHLETDEDIAAYLEAAFEEGDPSLVAAALATSPEPKAWRKSPATLASDAKAFTKHCRQKATPSLRRL